MTKKQIKQKTYPDIKLCARGWFSIKIDPDIVWRRYFKTKKQAISKLYG